MQIVRSNPGAGGSNASKDSDAALGGLIMSGVLDQAQCVAGLNACPRVLVSPETQDTGAEEDKI